MPRPRLHTLLFAIYPVLFLYSLNVGEVRPSAVVAPLSVTLASALVLSLALARAWRSPVRAGVAVSLLLVMFFSYGHLYEWLLQWARVRHRLLLPAWVAVWAVALVWVARTKRTLTRADRILNIVSGTAVVAALLTIAGTGASARAVVAPLDPPSTAAGSASRPLPDVYYIVLDAYASDAVLRSMYGFDNGPFLERLRRRGFYVASGSRSNYSMTLPSTAATLNMDYLEGLTRLTGTASRNNHVLCSLIENNRVERILEANGYAIVRIDPPPTMFYHDFPSVVLRTTLLAYADFSGARQRTLDVLRRLGEARPMGRPTFVYAHVMCPHEPYVFGPRGEPKPWLARTRAQEDPARKRRAYLDQLEYVNTRMDSLVGRILARSPRPPIIILQADHGPRNAAPMDRPTPLSLWEGNGILNAYYLPDGGVEELYPTISPVNTFRLLFRRYFGLAYPPLPDRSYHNWPSQQYRFIPAPAAGGEPVATAPPSTGGASRLPGAAPLR